MCDRFGFGQRRCRSNPLTARRPPSAAPTSPASALPICRHHGSASSSTYLRGTAHGHRCQRHNHGYRCKQLYGDVDRTSSLSSSASIKTAVTSHRHHHHSGALNVAGTVTATTFSGSGASLTASARAICRRSPAPQQHNLLNGNGTWSAPAAALRHWRMTNSGSGNRARRSRVDERRLRITNAARSPAPRPRHVIQHIGTASSVNLSSQAAAPAGGAFRL